MTQKHLHCAHAHARKCTYTKADQGPLKTLDLSSRNERVNKQTSCLNLRVLKIVMEVSLGSLSRNLGTQSSTPLAPLPWPQAMLGR